MNTCIRTLFQNANRGLVRSASNQKILSRHILALRNFAAIPDFVAPEIGLDEDKTMLHQMAQDFAQKELAPHAAEWDEKHIFPEDKLRALAQLGLAGLFVSEEVGGTALTRADGAVVFEALAAGCTSTTAYLTIHNMCASMIDKFGNDEVRLSISE